MTTNRTPDVELHTHLVTCSGASCELIRHSCAQHDAAKDREIERLRAKVAEAFDAIGAGDLGRGHLILGTIVMPSPTQEQEKPR